MKRRDLIALLCGAAVSWPIVAHAQSPMPVIGFLNSGSPNQSDHLVSAFRQGLSKKGFVEGRNVAIDYRWAAGHNERLSAMATDLVRRQVAVIVANAPAAPPAKKATATIPIVFIHGSDPVKAGLVTSLHRPGGNATGVTQLGGDLGPKRLQLLHQLAPSETDIALLLNPTSHTAETQAKVLLNAARKLRLRLHLVYARSNQDFDAVFAKLHKSRIGGLVISSNAHFNNWSPQLAGLALRYSIPSVYQYPRFTASGGLMSYGGDHKVAYRELGRYTGRILRGEKPGDLPVRRAERIEMILNVKTAKALGLTVPPALLARADEVIE